MSESNIGKQTIGKYCTHKAFKTDSDMASGHILNSNILVS